MTTKLDTDAIILGAGIVGAASAFHLARRGRKVVLIDNRHPAAGASFGNLGFVETGSIFPYAFPRRLADMLRYAGNKEPAARLDWQAFPELLPMLLRYWWHSGERRYQRIVEALLPLMRGAADEHLELARMVGAQDLYRPGGWMTLLTTAQQIEKAHTDLARLAAYGVKVRHLGAAEVRSLEPALQGEFLGALHWSEAWTSSDPAEVVLRLVRRFETLGGEFRQADASDLRQEAQGWSLPTERGSLTARDVVVALGSHATDLTRRFGYRIPLAFKRGYHQMYAYPEGTRLGLPVGTPVAGWAAVPLRHGIRLGTGVEFARRDAEPSYTQINKAAADAKTFVALGERLTEKPWLGIRPFMPDMLPVIGPAPRHEGLWFAFGHAHHGFTLGPVTGRLISEWICDGAPSQHIGALSPSRFR
jgi:D-amino-acid dehydrogenase